MYFRFQWMCRLSDEENGFATCQQISTEAVQLSNPYSNFLERRLSSNLLLWSRKLKELEYYIFRCFYCLARIITERLLLGLPTCGTENFTLKRYLPFAEYWQKKVILLVRVISLIWHHPGYTRAHDFLDLIVNDCGTGRIFVPNYAEKSLNNTFLRCKRYNLDRKLFKLVFVKGEENPLYKASTDADSELVAKVGEEYVNLMY